MTRLANTWCTVQAYYVCHSATQALCVAEGGERPSQHTTAKKAFVQLWVHRQHPIGPLSFAAVSSSSSRGNQIGGYLNGPGRAIDSTVHTWANCTARTCWDLAGKALRTTREEAVKERQSAARARLLKDRKSLWKRENEERLAAGKKPRSEPKWSNPRLPPAVRDKCEAEVREYTMVDYLYRLRVKANYEDAHMFTEGPDDEYVSTQVVKDLIGLAAGTLVAHEIRIARSMGPAWLLGAAEHWVGQHKTTGA
ncbi:hypothetical protein ACFVHA_28835, partial [Bacillus cereus]|uniref:hypothetical protein n=1 Tax=Bacillus cereus TaxID=1396 RepID=UPI003628F962